MAPLILHNVPEDELYVGSDGIQRPYAMVFSQQEGGLPPARNRRVVPETGSFGKSNRRSRSRTGTPRRERDNPTSAVADKIFGEWVSSQAAPAPTTSTNSNATRRPSSLAKSISQPLIDLDDVTMGGVSGDATSGANRTPTEMILRGYRNSTAQYSAIAHYEALAGRICEDYPRAPPREQRRYRSELTDPAFTQRRALTQEERAKVNMAAGGEHWVKVTFESAEAADAARTASPQAINGYLVYAEAWRGVPPAKDEATQDLSGFFGSGLSRSKSVSAVSGGHTSGPRERDVTGAGSVNPFLKRATSNSGFGLQRSTTSGDFLDRGSATSSHTIGSATASFEDVEPLHGGAAYLDRRRGFPADGDMHDTTMMDVDALEGDDVLGQQPVGANAVFCRKIPTAKRAKILPAEQALLPQQSVAQRIVGAIPFVSWFSGSIVGSAVPRSELGEFDWARASLYWKIVFLLDMYLRLFGGDIAGGSRDE